MCKAIYWIDDSTQGIMDIVHSVFPYLWDLEGKREEIETHVRIIGNGEQVTTGTSLWSKEDERKSSQAIMRMLERLCKNRDRMNQQKLYAKKKDLIENKFKNVYKSDDNDISEYRKLCLAWQDNNIMCYCDSDDQLSQWRGYCHNGGASIEFYFYEPLNYSILWANYDDPTHFELYENCPFPVIYFPCNATESDANDFKYFVSQFDQIELEDIWPYIKNEVFEEERELRMVFLILMDVWISVCGLEL